MSENRQTNAAPENGFAPSTTSNACFVFLRYWPGFSEQFPYGEFERISDEEIDVQLWASLKSELERQKVTSNVIERIRDDYQGFPGAEFMKLAGLIGWSDGLYHMEESARPRLCSRKVCIGVTTTSDEAEALMDTLRHQAVIENSAYDSWSDPESAWDDASLCNPRFFCVSASKLSPSGQVQARISIAQLQSGVARDNVEKRATKFVQSVDSFHEQWQQVNPAEVEPADSGTTNGAGTVSASGATLTREFFNTVDEFVACLVNGSDQRELTPSGLAWLEAYLSRMTDPATAQVAPSGPTDDVERSNSISKLILIREFNRQLHATSSVTAHLATRGLTTDNPTVSPPADPAEAAKPQQITDDLAAAVSSVPYKAKRNTGKGEAATKLIAALTLHHKYADGSCLNLEPIGNNVLAELANVGQGTASEFFTKQFKGHQQYKYMCADAGRLAMALKMLNGEFAPHFLNSARPLRDVDAADNEIDEIDAIIGD